MKKIFIPLFIVTFILIGLVFTVFTKFGNSLIASNLQEVLSNELQKDVKVERFNLSFNDINTTISFDDSKFVLDSIFDVFEQNVSANYLVDIKELGNLESLIDKKLNGSFFTLGKAVGTIEDVKVSGRAKVAKGDIKYFYAKESNILQADVKSIHLESLLYLLNEPLYIMGRLNTAINLRDFQGDIKTKIYNGYLNKKVLKLPEAISIKGDILTKLSKKEAISKADIYTSVANIHSKALKVDLKTTFIDGDYRLELYDFAKLEPFAKQRLRGKATVLGDITKDRDLVVNGNSKLLDGKLDFKLKNDDLIVNIDAMQIKSILYTAYYPEVFRANIDSKIDFDLKTQKGLIKATSSNGKFEKNQMIDLFANLTGVNLQKEVYNSIALESKIEKKLILSNLEMKSQNTKVITKDAKLDLGKEQIDSRVLLAMKNSDVFVDIKGSIKNPKVTIDAKDFLAHRLKKETKRALIKNDIDINQTIEKIAPKLPSEVQDLLKDGANDIINNLDKLFQ